jgi:hypothetical protein
MDKPQIICLTPVKNEAWILDRFLKCVSLWADYIIIADQNSDDGSREIARQYSKVILVDNPSESFNEPERQKILINEARKIPGKKLLITLDADEFLTANFINNPEWESVLNAKPGTIIKFQWVNIKPGFEYYWSPTFRFPWGFIDDGSEHHGIVIHSPRIPLPAFAPEIILNDIRVMHYQYLDWERMESKHRWYQCWERVNDPQRSAISIYRQYHHMYAINSLDLKPFQKIWLNGYQNQGIDMTSIFRDRSFQWDKEVLDYIEQYGASYFVKEAIWDINWTEKASEFNLKNVEKYRDPRGIFTRKVHSWLKRTQHNAYSFKARLIEKVLGCVKGW